MREKEYRSAMMRNRPREGSRKTRTREIEYVVGGMWAED